MSLRPIIKMIPGAKSIYIAIMTRRQAAAQRLAEIERLHAERNDIQEKLEAAQMLAVTAEIERDFAAKMLAGKR